MSIYRRHPRFCLLVAVVLGLAVGWFQGIRQAPRLQASGGSDRWDDRAVIAGSVGLEGNKQSMVVSHDAIYYLNYHLGTLLASVPNYKITADGTRVLSQFAERDLMKDFGLKPGAAPHFLMTTASLGLQSEGWSPLFVFETESGQVATYRVERQVTANGDVPRFTLVELRKDPRLAHQGARAVAR